MFKLNKFTFCVEHDWSVRYFRTHTHKHHARIKEVPASRLLITVCPRFWEAIDCKTQPWFSDTFSEKNKRVYYNSNKCCPNHIHRTVLVNIKTVLYFQTASPNRVFHTLSHVMTLLTTEIHRNTSGTFFVATRVFTIPQLELRTCFSLHFSQTI
jgi:hypothetical protein